MPLVNRRDVSKPPEDPPVDDPYGTLLSINHQIGVGRGGRTRLALAIVRSNARRDWHRNRAQNLVRLSLTNDSVPTSATELNPLAAVLADTIRDLAEALSERDQMTEATAKAVDAAGTWEMAAKTSQNFASWLLTAYCRLRVRTRGDHRRDDGTTEHDWLIAERRDVIRDWHHELDRRAAQRPALTRAA